MQFTDYLASIGRDGAALAAAARLGLEAPVPSCPGWTVADVVGHTGAVHRQKARIVRELLDANPTEQVEPPESGLIEWFEEGVDMLLDALASTDPATPAFTWYEPDQTVGFWYRRMAQETVIHRVDAELGHGIVGSVAPALAEDGIDEILTVMMVGHPAWATAEIGDRSFRLQCRDTGRFWDLQEMEWSGTSPASGTVYTREPGLLLLDRLHEVPDTIVSGTASGLDLFLWGRGSSDPLDVEGDATRLGFLRTLAAEVTG